MTKKATDLLAHYLPRAAKAWVDGLSAKKVVWNSDKKDYELTNYPDRKVRAECAEKIWHNVVGRPVERSLQVTGSYKELSVVLEELRQSPEAMRLLPRELFESITGDDSGQSNVEGRDAAPGHEGEAISQSEQKTG